MGPHFIVLAKKGNKRMHSSLIWLIINQVLFALIYVATLYIFARRRPSAGEANYFAILSIASMLTVLIFIILSDIQSINFNLYCIVFLFCTLLIIVMGIVFQQYYFKSQGGIYNWGFSILLMSVVNITSSLII